MAEIELRNVIKKYKKNTALDDINLLVRDKEFIVLFGPAGAGKTTMLKILAGLEQPNEGEILIDGQIVNVVAPANRNVSMVFENYALYPHMNVYDNIASPLRSSLHRKSEEVIRKEITKITKKMNIDKFLDRLPSQLSNGQRQRVALGRCLVRSPNVFLMDEPLAHLDAKIRHFMRAELKEMQESFDTTTIYVTHDYMEALSLGDRIVIINEGNIVQIGTGNELFYAPCNEFVARLMGEPEINLIAAQIVRDGKNVQVSVLGQTYEIPEDLKAYFREHDVTQVNLGVRGNDILYKKDVPNKGGRAAAEGGGMDKHSNIDNSNGRNYIRGSVYVLEPIGNHSILKVAVEDYHIRIIVPNNFYCEPDSNIFIKPDFNDTMFFDVSSGDFLVRHNLRELLEENARA